VAQAQREWFEKDYYKALGVSESATEQEIRRAYRKLAKQHHPDANPGSEDRFKELSAAYDVLSDAEKRREYDEVRRLGPAAGGFGSPGGNSEAQRNWAHAVAWEQGRPGDIIGFPGHVAIFLGVITGAPYILEASTVGVPVHVVALTRGGHDPVMYRFWS